MEQVLLPSPSGHSEWELEQKAALGFILLDVDKGGTILKKSRESLESVQDFQQTEKKLISFSLDGIFQENALCLDNLFLNSRYPSVDQIFSWDNRASCPVLQWEMPSVQPHDIQLSEPSGLFNLHGNLEQQLMGCVGHPSAPVSACTQHCKGEELPVPEEEVHHQAPVMLLNLHNNPEERNCFSGHPSNTLVLASPLGSVGDGLCLAETHLEHEVMSTCFLVPLSNKGESQGLSEEPFCLSEDNKGGVSPLSLERVSLPPVPEDKGSCLASVRDLGGSNSTPLSWQENYIYSRDCSAGAQKEEALGLLLNDLSCGAFHTHGDEGLCRSTKATEQDPYLETLNGGGKGHLSFPLHHPLSTESKVYKMCPDGETSQEGSPYGSLVFDQSGLMEVKRDLGLSTRVKRGDGLVSGHCLPADAVHDRKILYSEPSEARLLDTPELALDEKEGHGNVNLDASGDEVYHERYCSNGLALCLDASSPCSLWTSKQTVEGLSPSGVEVPSSLPVGSNDFSMDEDPSPLKVVFDALDQDRDGFVRIEEFVQFATAYGAEQVKHLTQFLDPSGLGVISFEDFYRGIAAIGNGDSDPQLYDGGCSPEGEEAGGCPEEYEDYAAFEQNEVTDSAYLGSESAYSECETFTDEDTGALPHPELHEEVETDSAIDGTLHDTEEVVRRLSLSSELNSHSLITVLGRQEEHFEDFGEGQDSELLPEIPDRMEEDSSPPESILCSSLLLSPSADPLPASFQSFLREGALGFFCSQCCKQISRLEDLSTRLNSLEMNSTSKTLSSRKVARHLHQSSTLTLGSIEDLSRDILELGDTDITDKVMFLERRVSELEKDSSTNEEQHTRLRQENLQLVHRSNALEEQLKEQEMQAEEALQLELRRRKDAMGKLERERGMELENLLCRLQQLDEENSELRSCVPCLQANIERLEEEKRKLQEEVEDVAERLGEELESRRKLSDKLSHERHKSEMEKECTQELIEDLRKQLEHLQLYKLEMEARRGRSANVGLQEYQNRTREAELEQEIRRLKQDNRSLKEQNDELNGQIINLSIQGAKNLFGASFSESLAAEISSVSRDELMEAIHKQEDINYRLQDYIDRIIVAIMESSPSILEVK